MQADGGRMPAKRPGESLATGPIGWIYVSVTRSTPKTHGERTVLVQQGSPVGNSTFVFLTLQRAAKKMRFLTSLALGF